MTATQEIGGWAATIAGLLIPGVIAMVLWTPFLKSDRFSNLFTALPPKGSLTKSYIPIALLASIPAVAGFLAALAVSPTNGEGAAMSNTLIDYTVYLTTGYAVAVPILGAAVAPALGIDWDANDYPASTWLVLGFGGACYALIFAVPVFIFALLIAFPA